MSRWLKDWTYQRPEHRDHRLQQAQGISERRRRCMEDLGEHAVQLARLPLRLEGVEVVVESWQERRGQLVRLFKSDHCARVTGLPDDIEGHLAGPWEDVDARRSAVSCGDLAGPDIPELDGGSK